MTEEWMIRKTKSFCQSKIVIGLICCTVVGLIVTVCFVARVWKIGNHAESQIQSVNFVCRLLIHRIETHGDWPGKWEELQTDSLKNRTFSLPKDQKMLESFVTIRFNLSLRDVAQMTPDSFDAMQPNDKPCYNYQGVYESIIDAAKKRLVDDLQKDDRNRDADALSQPS